MLYSITILLALYACISPLLYREVVKMGIRLAEKPEEVAEEPVFSNIKPKKHARTQEEEDELRKLRTEWENLEAYDGTGMNQKEVI